MAQHEGAAGGEAVASDSSQPANDPIEALVDEFLGDEDQQEPAADEGADPEFGGEDDEGEEPETAIDPPASWKAEEKQFFKSLPREAQEAITRRETERDQFVRLKSEEVVRTRRETERQALEHIGQLQAHYAQQLQHYAAQFDVPQPDPQLIVDDPESYALQMRQYQYATAQRHQAQQQADYAQAQAAQAEEAQRANEAEEFAAVLSQQFPEFLEPQNAKLREQLGSIAIELGYPADQLQHVSATDVLAMRQAAEWKAKADKLDQLNRSRMETVRAAKNLPPVARPGTASTKARQSASRAASAWERTKATRSGSDFADFLEASGIKL